MNYQALLKELGHGIRQASQQRVSNTRFGKNDVRYWERRVRKSRSVRGDQASENCFYSVALQHACRRMEISLRTADQREAAIRAKEMYFYLVSNGWAAFLAKYRAVESPRNPEVLTLNNHGVLTVIVPPHERGWQSTRRRCTERQSTPSPKVSAGARSSR
jgi:hypothetical protein